MSVEVGDKIEYSSFEDLVQKLKDYLIKKFGDTGHFAIAYSVNKAHCTYRKEKLRISARELEEDNNFRVNVEISGLCSLRGTVYARNKAQKILNNIISNLTKR